MVADNQRNIIYINDAIKKMFSRSEQAIQIDLPSFSTAKLVGRSIDEFHQDPEHQAEMLRKLKQSHQTTINIGGRTFQLIVSPTFDAQGKRLGSTVEWLDITEKLNTERQIRGIIQEAIEGAFNYKIQTNEHNDPFIQQLSSQINELLDTVKAPVDQLTQLLPALADGALHQQMDGSFQGKFKELKDSFNGSINNLRKMVADVASHSQQIRVGSDEIASGNNDLSSRIAEQAASLEETAASMDQMSSSIKQTADNSQQANQLSNQTHQLAIQGQQVVQQTSKAMEGINESSQKISEISSLIDSIAFQTNLLALNAAVEAARAGDQGRGFAVVAGEVRNLAQKTAEAAREIKGLIEESVEKANLGADLTQQSEQALNEILHSVSKVSDVINEIADASREQFNGIEQVNLAISQLDSVNQQNSALVEEVAAASSSMKEQAHALSDGMKFFKMEKSEMDDTASTQQEATTNEINLDDLDFMI